MINGAMSELLICNVFQSSAIGLKLFLDYESPVGNIIRQHGLEAYFCADNLQIYLDFKSVDEEIHVDLNRVERCIEDVCRWMADIF